MDYGGTQRCNSLYNPKIVQEFKGPDKESAGISKADVDPTQSPEAKMDLLEAPEDSKILPGTSSHAVIKRVMVGELKFV